MKTIRGGIRGVACRTAHRVMDFAVLGFFRVFSIDVMSTDSTLVNLNDDQVVEGLVGGVPFVA